MNVFNFPALPMRLLVFINLVCGWLFVTESRSVQAQSDRQVAFANRSAATELRSLAEAKNLSGFSVDVTRCRWNSMGMAVFAGRTSGALMSGIDGTDVSFEKTTSLGPSVSVSNNGGCISTSGTFTTPNGLLFAGGVGLCKDKKGNFSLQVTPGLGAGPPGTQSVGFAVLLGIECPVNFSERSHHAERSVDKKSDRRNFERNYVDSRASFGNMSVAAERFAAELADREAARKVGDRTIAEIREHSQRQFESHSSHRDTPASGPRAGEYGARGSGRDPNGADPRRDTRGGIPR